MEKIKTNVCENEQYLSFEDELQLIKDIKSGGTERDLAIEKLAHSKLRFIVAVAKIYRGCGLSMEELISAGNRGLILAGKTLLLSVYTIMTLLKIFHLQNIVLISNNAIFCK